MSYTAKVIAVLGRTLRAGRWKLADESLVIAVFGRCVLDLSRAYVDEEDEELDMSIFCLFGSVSVILPPGCDVEPSGIAFLASSEVEIPSEKASDITSDVLAPMDISWFAMFGRVRINEVQLGLSADPEEVETLPPPDVAVLDGGSPASAGADAVTSASQAPAPDTPPVAEEADSTAAEQAAAEEALRNEIAQWRSETGRPAPSEADASDADESEAEPADADAASEADDTDTDTDADAGDENDAEVAAGA